MTEYRRPRTRTMAITTSLGVTLILGACGAEIDDEDPLTVGVVQPALLADTIPCTPTTFSFRVCWLGNSAIGIKVPSSVSEEDFRAIEAVMLEWNKLLGEGKPGVPSFNLGRGTGGNVDVVFAATSTSGYCGAMSGDRQHHTITLYPSNHARCTNSPIGGVEQVMRHELAHAIGWTDGAEGRQVVGTSDHCAVNNAGLMFRGQVCLHEVEGVFRAYNGDSVPTEFWATAILKQTNLDTNQIKLSVGQTKQLAVSQLYSIPPAAYYVALPATASMLTFRSAAPVVANVSGAGLVSALAAGSARIQVSGNPAQIPAGMMLWRPNRVKGDSVRVVVEPDTLLRVTNVTSQGAPPFTVGGTKTFVATVKGALPSPAVQVTWAADFSYNGPGIDYSATGGTSTSIVVPGGSYRIELRATPKQGNKTGAAYQSQWPVCTTETPLRGAPQPNRPGGC